MPAYATFYEKGRGNIRKIPAGRVITYGQIVRVAGSTRAARQVVRILHSMSKSVGCQAPPKIFH